MPTPEITLVTLDYPPDRGGVARFLGNLVAQAAGAMDVLVPEGHATDGPGRVKSDRLFGKMWPRWWPLVAIIKRMKVGTSAVFVSQVFPVGTAAWISKLLGGPEYAVLFHGLDLKLVGSAWKRWLLRHICGEAKVLFVNSRATRSILSGLVPHATAIVLTPGVEEVRIPTREQARKELGLADEAKIVLSVTRLVPRKGIDLSLHALARIQAERDVEYVVVGDGPDKQRLQEYADEHRTKVRWVTQADDKEKWLWFAAADIFVLPVREEREDVEGFGIVYLEAALAGIPSVAGRSGGAGEAVRDGLTGLLVNPKSIDEVEAALVRLLDDPELCRRLGEAGRARALANFRWSDRWAAVAGALGISGMEMHGAGDWQEPADIAVVIPCYNHARELERTLLALANQTLAPREVMVVDNGSTDDPKAVAEKFKDYLPLKIVRFDERRGAPAARNHGASLTRAANLVFLDADVELVPEALQKLSAALEADPDADFAYPDFYWDFKKFTAKAWDVDSLRQRNYIHTTALIRRQAFPGFDESLKKFQDWDLWLTMAENGSRGTYVPGFLFRVRQRAAGMSAWLPKFVHGIRWPILGWMPQEIRKYREAEKIIKEKHKR